MKYWYLVSTTDNHVLMQLNDGTNSRHNGFCGFADPNDPFEWRGFQEPAKFVCEDEMRAKGMWHEDAHAKPVFLDEYKMDPERVAQKVLAHGLGRMVMEGVAGTSETAKCWKAEWDAKHMKDYLVTPRRVLEDGVRFRALDDKAALEVAKEKMAEHDGRIESNWPENYEVYRKIS